MIARLKPYSARTPLDQNSKNFSVAVLSTKSDTEPQTRNELVRIWDKTNSKQVAPPSKDVGLEQATLPKLALVPPSSYPPSMDEGLVNLNSKNKIPTRPQNDHREEDVSQTEPGQPYTDDGRH